MNKQGFESCEYCRAEMCHRCHDFSGFSWGKQFSEFKKPEYYPKPGAKGSDDRRGRRLKPSKIKEARA